MLYEKKRMCELDPDVVRWGLHLIDVTSLTSKGSPQSVTCYEQDLSTTDTVSEVFCSSTDSILENDEVIAHALQEELSRLASTEASSGEQHQQASSVLAQEWLTPSGRHSNSKCLGSEKGARKNGAVLSEFVDLSVDSQDEEVLPEFEHESILDGELGKRLNQMVPVPHVPKINGEIPSVDEASSDHERLLNRLQLYELVELKISGDGNCQFRSLSDQIYRTPEHHKFVREQVVDQLKSRSHLYENYVPMAYADYVKKMSKNGEWGDHVTLQAAADWDTCYIEILPQSLKSNRTIFLSFWAEVHYNSIYPLGEMPVADTKKKKRWLW